MLWYGDTPPTLLALSVAIGLVVWVLLIVGLFEFVRRHGRSPKGSSRPTVRRRHLPRSGG